MEPNHTSAKKSWHSINHSLLSSFNPFFLQERLFGRKDCIEYANLRARALPKHEPNESGFTNISLGGTATFTEHRPVRSAYYYLLLVSSAVVSFQLKLR
jgi:hypothetical protein